MNFNYLMQANIPKTILMNFKLFPIRTAIKLPLLIGKHSSVKIKRGGISIDGNIRPGMIAFGVGGSPDLIRYESRKNVFWVQNGGRVVFKGRAHFATHANVLVSGSKLEFGKGFGCNVGCRFSSVAGVTFGEDCLLGGSCVVRDSDGHKVFDCNEEFEKTLPHASSKEIFIGDHVWIANNSSVLKGVSIDSNNIISYGSLVVKPVEGQYQIIAGTPAKVVKRNIIWEH